MRGSAIRHIPARPKEVLAVATDPATWEQWLRLGEAQCHERLDTVGREATGVLRTGRGRDRAVTWLVTARLRDIVRLGAVAADGEIVAQVTVGCSWWDGQCATELAVEVEGSRRGLRTEARLRRALARLEQRVIERRTQAASASTQLVVRELLEGSPPAPQSAPGM